MKRKLCTDPPRHRIPVLTCARSAARGGNNRFAVASLGVSTEVGGPGGAATSLGKLALRFEGGCGL
eukprot:4855020-Pyramimonas_sp.AAC.1